MLSSFICRFKGEEYESAYFFLKEPIYHILYDTAIVNWALWPLMEDYFSVDPYAIAYEFFRVGAQAGQTDNEIFVFVESP